MGRIGGGRARRSLAIPATMTAVHGHVQQRAEQEQEERQPAEEVNTMLADEQIGQPCAEGCEGEDTQDAS